MLNTPIEQNKPSSVTHTIAKKEVPSGYAYATADDSMLENEFTWLGWKDNEEDRREGQKNHKAFRAWHDFAKAAVEVVGEFESDRFKRRFGSAGYPQDTKDMFDSMLDSNTGRASHTNSQMVNYRQDSTFANSLSCKENPGMYAYTHPSNGWFHFCSRRLDLPSKQRAQRGSTLQQQRRSVYDGLQLRKPAEW
jgi:hypothetical protein